VNHGRPVAAGCCTDRSHREHTICTHTVPRRTQLYYYTIDSYKVEYTGTRQAATRHLAEHRRHQPQYEKVRALYEQANL